MEKIMRKFSKLPFSPLYKFKARRQFIFHGREYNPGDEFPAEEDAELAGAGLKRKLYEQHRIEPYVPEATLEEGQNEGGDGVQNEGENTVTGDGEGVVLEPAASQEGVQIEGEGIVINEKGSLSEASVIEDKGNAELVVDEAAELAAAEGEAGPYIHVRPFKSTHKGFGKFEVTDANGIIVSSDLKKAEAEALIA